MLGRLFDSIFQNQPGFHQDDSICARSFQPLTESPIPDVASSSPELNYFIEACRKNIDKNTELSNHFDPEKLYLMCCYTKDFPLIPVRFNGRLYDYDALMATAQYGKIKDPITKQTIELTAQTIQPDFDAQSRMDALLLQIKNSASPAIVRK
jgi:hypothetical protein